MSDKQAPPPTFEIPDLELAAPVSHSPRPPQQAKSEVAALPQTGGLGLEIELPALEDELHGLELAPDIELSTAPSPSKPNAARADWPDGRTPAFAQLNVDPNEVVRTADYGDAPGLFAAPLYAYRVLARRLPLRRDVTSLRAQLARAELARDRDLMQLALELRPTLEQDERFRRLLEPASVLEREASERDAALTAADAGYRAEMARFDAELVPLREAEARAAATRAELARELEGTRAALARAQAKAQRIQIEIRGVHELARQVLGPAGGELPPEHAAKLAELQARERSLEPELSSTTAAQAAAAASERQADNAQQLARDAVRKVERAKATAAGTLQKQMAHSAERAAEAEELRRAALAEVARAVLAARGAIAVPEAWLQLLQSHDHGVTALAVRLETHVRALDAFDRQRVRQGLLLGLSALGVVLLSILLKAVL